MCTELKVLKRKPKVCFELAGFNFLCGILPLGFPKLSFSFCLCLSLAFGPWADRVEFKSNQPTKDSSMVIKTTKISDEGKYTCHVSTFPFGNFEAELSLFVHSESFHHDSGTQYTTEEIVCCLLKDGN